MKEYELLMGDATGRSSLFFFLSFSAVSSRKRLEIDNTKLTSPNKPLGKADSAFFLNTQTNVRSLQPESMCVNFEAFKKILSTIM